MRRFFSFCQRNPFAATVIGVALVFYAWVSVHVGFLADDFRYIYEIHQHSNPLDFVLHPYTNVFGWRPLADLSWVFNVVAFGTHPLPYHLFNLAVFAATLPALFATVRMFAHERVALWTTAIFAAMPNHYEAIVWLSGRTDSLALLFCLLALYCYMRFRQSTQPRAWKWLVLSVVVFTLAIFSKESVILAPGICIVVDWLCTAKHVSWQRRVLPILPFAAVIAAFVLLRVAIVGGVVSGQAAFTQQYSIIPKWEHLLATVHAYTLLFNRSTASALLPLFPQLWQWVVLPLGCALLAALCFAVRLWRRGAARTTCAVAVAAIFAFCVPVFSLIPNISPDLMHTRLLYAPSVGVALAVAVLCTGAASKAGVLLQRVGLASGMAVCALATIVNAQPWIEATHRTQTFVHTFAASQPALATATAPTFVYLLHTPSEYRGAYLFHDYYSVQQAIRQHTKNAHLTVQTVGTKPVYPAPYCDETLATDTRVLAWNGNGFDDETELIAEWNAGNADAADIDLRSSGDWEQVGLRAHDMEYHFSGTQLIMEHFGKRPRLAITLPNNAHTSHWKTLLLQTNAQQPIRVSWDAPKATAATINSLLLEQANDATVPLCAYPNWVVHGRVRTIQLTFQPGQQQQITVDAFALR